MIRGFKEKGLFKIAKRIQQASKVQRNESSCKSLRRTLGAWSKRVIVERIVSMTRNQMRRVKVLKVQVAGEIIVRL